MQIERPRHWLPVGRLRAYASEVNSVKTPWVWPKHGSLAKVADEGLDLLATRVRRDRR